MVLFLANTDHQQQSKSNFQIDDALVGVGSLEGQYKERIHIDIQRKYSLIHEKCQSMYYSTLVLVIYLTPTGSPNMGIRDFP